MSWICDEHGYYVGPEECAGCLKLEIERLKAETKKQETAIACLRGLQKAGNDMCDNLRREWEKSELLLIQRGRKKND